MNKIQPFALFLIFIAIAGCASNSPELIISTNSDYAKIQNNNIDFENYLDNLKHLQLDAASISNLDNDEQEFMNAVRNIIDGDLQEAETILKELVDSAPDSTIKSSSIKIISNILFYQSRWKELNEWSGKYGSAEEQSIITKAFLNANSENYYFANETITLPLTKSSSGSPVIPVKINGVEMKFWLDTGAGMSVLSSDVAEMLNIKPVIEKQGEAVTATTIKVGYQPTVIDSLQLGELLITNHPAIIIDESNLKFKLLGLFTVMKIDGIIGWNAIKNFSLELNYKEDTATIKKPVKNDNSGKNLFWLGYPFVLLKSEGGVPLCFGLDTGARTSSITKNIFRKLKFENLKNIDKSVGGAGGFENITAKEIPGLTLLSDSTKFTFKNIQTLPAKGAVFFLPDGILGADIFNNSSIIIDYINGRFVYNNYSSEKND